MGDEITVKWKTENINSNAVMSVCIKKLDGDCVAILTENDGEIKYDLKNYNQSARCGQQTHDPLASHEFPLR